MSGSAPCSAEFYGPTDKLLAAGAEIGPPG